MNNVAQISLGCVTFGREIGEEAAFAMMDHAVQHGITHFDTAAAYAAGASEKVVGAWLAARPEMAKTITTATKVLPPYNNEQLIPSVDASLERLGIDKVDILYLHRWDTTVPTKEVLEALDELVCSGKVRSLGASNFNAEQLRDALVLQRSAGYASFRVVQNNHNLAVSDLTNDFRKVCRDYALEIITYSPLGAGFLTGKHQQGVAPGSRFDVIKGHQDVYFNEKAYQRLARQQEVSERTGHSMVQIALAWALHQPVSSVLIGGRTTAHIDQALAAARLNDPNMLAELDN
jgi:aryl-alcohol dehydrogenase-like predicted oxidoreductase